MNNYNYPYRGRVEKKPKLFTRRELLYLLIILLASMNFYAYGLHIMVAGFLLYCVTAGRLHYVDGLFAHLLLCVAVLFFWKDSLSGPSAMTKWMVWPMAFLIGYEMTALETPDAAGVEKTEKKVRYYTLIVAMGFFIHFAMNFYINRGETSLGRNTNDIWSKDVRAATGQAALACVPVGWCISSFLNNSGIKKRIPAVVGLVVILMYNLVLSTRTVFLMLLIVAVVAVIYLIVAGDKAQKKTYTLLTVLVVLVLVVVGYQANVFNIQDYFEESEFYKRFFAKSSTQDISEDSRMDNKLRYFNYMFVYMWGGDYIRRRVGGYAHDLFLDIYNDAGILAFIATIMMVWGSARILLRLLKNKKVRFETRMTMLCIFTAIYMEFMIEPIFAGEPVLLMMFCFLYGVAARMDRNLTQLYSTASK